SSFFCQAEDGIRDATVTGVQTCALPISIEGRFCVMTVPMQELVIVNLVRPAARAGCAMIHLNDLLHSQEVQSAPGAAPTLSFQQPADPSWDFGMCLEPLGPIQQIPVVGAGGALDLRMPLDRNTRVA